MDLVFVVALSLAAGWLVNATVDALPERKPYLSVWRQPLTALGCTIRGRIGNCDRKYALRVLVTWLLATGMGLLAYQRLGMTVEAGITALYAWFFLAVAVIDLEHRRVLNRMLLVALPVVALVILAGTLSHTNPTIIAPSPRFAIIGAGIGFGVFLLTALVRPGGMGMGDVKLAGLIGLATGVFGVAVALLVGIVAGGVAGFILMLRHRFDSRATMAYAPYLSFGVWVALYFGVDLWQVYLA